MTTIFEDSRGVLIDSNARKRLPRAVMKEFLKLKTSLDKKRRGNLHSQILFRHDNASLPDAHSSGSFDGKLHHTLLIAQI